MKVKKLTEDLSIEFHGGYGSVTGSNFVVDYKGERGFADCGLFQGAHFKKNATKFEYDPRELKWGVVTHAHIDHIGRLPIIVREGFSGNIYCTPPTRALIPFMLEDAYGIMEYNHLEFNRPMLYSRDDIEKVISLLRPAEYGKTFGGDVKMKLYNSSHILGSAMVLMDFDGVRVLFTGDLGSKNSPLLKDLVFPKESVDYVVMESVYGNREQDNDEGARMAKMRDVGKRIVDRGATALFPVFSLQRLQDVLHDIYMMKKSGELRGVSVYVDSPLGNKVSNVFAEFKDYLKDGEIIEKILNFEGLKIVKDSKESYGIHKDKNPKFVLAGSGMSSGGRVLSHEKFYSLNPDNMIVFTGYQGVGTLGRRILSGDRTVLIDGKRVEIKAEIVRIEGYSGHMEGSELVEFANTLREKNGLKKAFCVMGDPEAEMFLAQRLRDYCGLDAEAVL